MTYKCNFLMTVYEMFTAWGRTGGNDLETIVKEQMVTDIEQNGFNGLNVILDCADDQMALNIDDKSYEELCKLITDDISVSSKFFQAVTIDGSDEDKLWVDWGESGDDECLSYWIEVKIDFPKLVNLYLKTE